MSINFDEILLELSYRIPEGIVDLTKEHQVKELAKVLSEYGFRDSVRLAKEAGDKFSDLSKADKEKKSDMAKQAADMGLVHKGQGYYSKGENGEIAYKSDAASGKIVPLTPDEKARINKGTQPTATEKPVPPQQKLPTATKQKAGTTPATTKATTQTPGQPQGGEQPMQEPAGKIPPSEFKTDAEKKAQANKETNAKADTKTNQNNVEANSESFKSALASTANKGKNTDKFITTKAAAANKTIDAMLDDSGNLPLLSGQGGHPVKINGNALKSVMSKIFNGDQLSPEEVTLANSAIKLVTNPDNGTVKIYFAKKYVGRHPQQGYDSILIQDKNVAMGDAIRKFALKTGLNVGKSSEGAIGKKVLNPKKLATSINPNQPEKTVEIKKEANGISIGGKVMTKKQVPNEQELIKSLTSKYGTKADTQARLIINQTEAYNQKLDDLAIAAQNATPPGHIPMANFGDVTTPENRIKTSDAIINGAINRFETELDKYGNTFGKPNLKTKPENQKVFQSLDRLKELNSKYDLENNKESQGEYKTELDNLLLNMANSSDFVDSVADFAEIKAGLQFLSEGKQVYFPAAENFQTADIIVMPDEFSVKPKPGQSLEEAISENLRFYEVSVTYVGGLSVKYKGGGGSANYSKIAQTEYKHKETQERLLRVQAIYNTAYPQNKENQLHIQNDVIMAGEKEVADTLDYAVRSGIITADEAKLVVQGGIAKADAMLKKTLKDVARCADADRGNFERAIKLHHVMQQMTAVINNRDVKYTRFSNFNQEISQNKNGVSFKVKDDIADGVSKPCYMNPHHNPGFTITKNDENGCVTALPTNQNPSHISSTDTTKNLLKGK